MMKKISLLLPLLSILASSCSVVMASNKKGTNIESIQSLRSREQLIALGAESIRQEKNEEGETVESFKILKEKGSIARAFMHGMLDISTAFIWELAGTPIEGVLSEEKYFCLKITFDQNDNIKRVELI